MLQFFSVLLICILSGVEVDLFIPSFPELLEEFNLSPFLVQFTLSINFIAYCFCALFSGTLGDKYNRRHVIIISLWIFVIGSILCVTAINYPMLVIGRFLHGVGMGGPVVLAYAVIADSYPVEKQIGMLGMLNGASAIAMAFAPTLGSYVNLYFHWRGNFVILLILALISLIACYFSIPHSKGDRGISLSPRAYVPLLQSPQLLAFMLTISFLVVPYWVFIGMSPIFYMEALGVPLKNFGFYQGAIAGVFAVVSLASPKILNMFGEKKCLMFGAALCLLSNVLMFFLTILASRNPLSITLAMLILAAGVLFPINILYPHALQIIPNAKGRATAILMASRLIFSAICLQVVSYLYTGEFLYIGAVILLFLTLGLFTLGLLFQKKWLALN